MHARQHARYDHPIAFKAAFARNLKRSEHDTLQVQWRESFNQPVNGHHITFRDPDYTGLDSGGYVDLYTVERSGSLRDTYGYTVPAVPPGEPMRRSQLGHQPDAMARHLPRPPDRR